MCHCVPEQGDFLDSFFGWLWPLRCHGCDVGYPGEVELLHLDGELEEVVEAGRVCQ